MGAFPPNTVIKSGSLVIHCDDESVLLDDKQIEVTGLTYRLLETLLNSNGEVLTIETISQRTWGNPHVSYETIAQRISMLRKLILDENRLYIGLVRGVGYKWLPDVVRSDVTTQLPSSEEAQDRAGFNSRWWIIAIASITFAIVGFAFYYDRQSHATPETIAPTNTTQALSQRAQNYAQQKNNTGNRLAIELYQQHLANTPDDIEARFELAALLIERVAKYDGDSAIFDQVDSHLAIIQQTASIEPWQKSWLEGYYYDVAGQIDRAIALYESALSTIPSSSDKVTGSLAYLYSIKGRLFEALNLNLSTLHGQGHYRYLQVAEVLYLANIQPAASEWIAAARTLAPDDNFASILATKYWLVNEEYGQMQAALNTIHQLDIRSAESMVYESILALVQNRFDDAETLLQEATGISNTSILAGPLLAWTARRTGNTSVKVPELLPTDIDSWPNQHLANSIIYLVNSDQTNAISELQLAAQKGFLDYRLVNALPPFKAIAEDPEFIRVINGIKRSTEIERRKIELIELPDINQLVPAGSP